MNMRWFRNRAGEQKGAVLVVTSVAMVAMIGATALAVDVGRVTVNNRSLQAQADVIAMDAGRSLSGATAAALTGTPGAPGAIVTAVQNSATRNGVPFSKLTVHLGTMSGTTFTNVATPVVNGVIQTVTSTSVPTAVQVNASGSVNFAFQPGTKTTNRSATATYSATAGFSIGSWLASIPAGGDGILNALLGDAFSLNAVGYSGLANANVTLEALGANIPVTALSPTQLLSTSVGIRDFMLASIATLNAQGNPTAVAVLNSMIANASLTGTVQLGEIIDVMAGAETAAATASINLLQLLTASAFVLERDGGQALSIPTAGLSLPGGIASVTASLSVIEPPRIYFGPAGGPSVETAQVRLSITPVVDLPIGIPGLLNVSVSGSLPITLNVAGATGTLTNINCATPSITVASTTQAVNLETDISLTVKAKVLFLVIPVASLTLEGGAKTTPGSYTTTFVSPGEFGPSNFKSVGSDNLGLAGLLNFSNADVVLLGGISLGQIASAVIPAVNGLLGSLDSVLVEPLTSVLGLKLGGADIAALGINCSGLRLAG